MCVVFVLLLIWIASLLVGDGAVLLSNERNLSIGRLERRAEGMERMDDDDGDIVYC